MDWYKLFLVSILIIVSLFFIYAILLIIYKMFSAIHSILGENEKITFRLRMEILLYVYAFATLVYYIGQSEGKEYSEYFFWGIMIVGIVAVITAKEKKIR